MTISPNLSISYLVSDQAQKHVTVNEALRMLDALVQLSVLSQTQVTAPATPLDGDRYIVGAGATGVWLGKEAQIAAYQDGAWAFFPPNTGWQSWVEDQAVLIVFDGTVWENVTALDQVEQLGIGAAADSTNRLLVQSNSTLFTSLNSASGGTGNVRTVLSKEAISDTASIVLQSGFVGHAEIGLIGDNDFRFKVSADGQNFSDAIILDAASSFVGIGTNPVASYRLAVLHDTPLSGGVSIANYNTGVNASSVLRLNAANGNYFKFQLYGSGTIYAITNATMVIGTYATEPIYFKTDTVDRMTIQADGRISIGTTTASAMLSVNGSIRPGQTAQVSLPNPAIEGAGALLFASDLGTNGELVFSDGANWRVVRTGAIA